MLRQFEFLSVLAYFRYNLEGSCSLDVEFPVEVTMYSIAMMESEHYPVSALEPKGFVSLVVLILYIKVRKS